MQITTEQADEIIYALVEASAAMTRHGPGRLEPMALKKHEYRRSLVNDAIELLLLAKQEK